MKKLLIFVLFIIFIPVVLCENDFFIDTTKLEINSKGDSLIEKLDKSYKIDTKGFVSTELVNEEAKKYTKKIINIIFNSDSIETRSSELHKEQLISSSNGFDTLSSLSFINMFVQGINELDIKYDYVKLIRTVEFNQGVITLSYFPNANINGNIEDFILVLYLKEGKNGYKLFMPWFTKGEDLEEYFNNLGNKEEAGDNIGGTYKNLSLGDSNVDSIVNVDHLEKLYKDNASKNVSISALADAGTNVYGSGFFISKGLVVTSWSLLLEMLNNSEFLYVNDVNKNSYNIKGIVAADTEYDFVILKLNEEVGIPVNFSSKQVSNNDNVFVIDSKSNNGFMVNYGKNVTMFNGKYKNLLALNKSDVGSALYNSNGEVVGFNTGNSLDNEISIANSTDYIIELQKELSNKEFKEIKSVSFKEFKEKYYHRFNSEEVFNDIPKKVWNKYKDVGNIEKSINLDLIKASYVDNIISLRYKNKAYKSINSFYLSADFEKELVNDNYELIYNDDLKKIYSKNNINVIIKQYLDYLVVLIMEN